MFSPTPHIACVFSPTPSETGTNLSMAENLSQFAAEVVNFSSQYGTQGSGSYTASNLAGELRIYDSYGDRTEAFVLVCVYTYSLTRPFSIVYMS